MCSGEHAARWLPLRLIRGQISAARHFVQKNLLIWLVSFVLSLGVACAEGPTLIAPTATVVDLGTEGTSVAAQRRNVALEVPGETEAARVVLELRGQGPGPDFNWTLFTLKNAAKEARDFVLIVDAQRLAGSGLLRLKPFGSKVETIVWAAAQDRVKRQAAANGDAYAFSLQANSILTLGIEGEALLQNVHLVEFNAFVQQEATAASLRSAMLAAGLLLALAALLLFSLRHQMAFAVGGFFAFAVLLFVALETGYLDAGASGMLRYGMTPQNLRAFVEGLLALAVALCFWRLTNVSKRTYLQSLPYIILILLALVILGISWVNPMRATALARIVIVVTTIAGFVVALRGRKSNNTSVDNAVLMWSAILAWIFAAALAALSSNPAIAASPVLMAGLVAVLGLVVYGLLRHAFKQGYTSQPYLADANRRSLALAGAQHFLWDWQPQDNMLEVSSDLARALGHDPKLFHGPNAARSFLRLIHQADELAYLKCTNTRDLKAGQFIEQDLRIANSKGEYHWFALRARALPGSNKLAERCIGTLTDVTRSKVVADNLIHESVHDPVTGLPTRALFVDRLEREIKKPLGIPVRIMLIGIERFKALNDGLGHDLGDQLLLAAGQRIAECLTPDETLARISGSQYAVMFIETIDGRSAMDLARQIAERLGEPMTAMTQQIYLSVCIGISQSSNDVKQASVLQQQAASALHEAQIEGPDTCLVYDDDMVDERGDKVALEADLRRAIDRHEIEVHYQPIVELETRIIAGFEALARWRHPERGMLQPAEFIGIAEQTGLIGEVGDLVLAEAARQMGIWQRVLTRNRPVFMAINVSSDQLSDTSFLDKLGVIIAREALAPQSLKVELTESVVMRYPERARQLIARLRSLGVGVACDDFGTGFSNLASLRDLQFDTLKMDRSFIMAGGLDGRGGMILNSVIDLAHSLGMKVVAEGIEDEHQAAKLVALGCDLGQGYLLGAPMTPREVHGHLAVLPVVAQLAATPVPGFAPMAPRPLATFESRAYQSPEELPSLFKVKNPPVRKAAKPKKPKAKKKPAKPAAKKKR